MGQPVHKTLVHAEGDALVQHGPQKQLAAQLLPRADGGKHKDPGVELIRGEEKMGQRVQRQGGVLLRILTLVRFLFGRAFLLAVPDLFQP